jgi:hypothetical protein
MRRVRSIHMHILFLVNHGDKAHAVVLGSRRGAGHWRAKVNRLEAWKKHFSFRLAIQRWGFRTNTQSGNNDTLRTWNLTDHRLANRLELSELLLGDAGLELEEDCRPRDDY